MLRRTVYLPVIVLIIAFAVFPMQGMERTRFITWHLNNTDAGRALGPEITADYTRELTLSFIYSPLNLEMLCVLFGGLGFGSALALFRHLFSRKQSMMIAALPMTRSRDFLLRCLVHALWCLLPLGLCAMIHPLVVWGNGLGAFFDLRVYAGRTAAAMLIDLYGFALGALCASLFGTLWSAGLGGLVIAGSAELAAYGWIRIASMYLGTMYRPDVEKAMLRRSPVYSLYKAFYVPDLGFPLGGLIAAAVMLALAWLAYRGARPENAGHTLNMKRLETVMLTWACVLGGTAGAVVLCLYLERELLLYLGLLLGAAAAWLLARMLLDQRFRISLRKWKAPAAAVCLMAAVLVCLRGGWFGYNAYAPSASDLSAIRVRPELGPEEMVFTDREGVDACLSWAGQMRAEAAEARGKAPFKSVYGSVLMSFEEKDGRTVTRQYLYPGDPGAVLPALRVIAEETECQRAERIDLSGGVNCYSSLDGYDLSEAEFREIFGFSTNLKSYSGQEAREIREALRLDLRARTLDTLQQPTLLNLCLENRDPVTGVYGYAYYQIRPDDANTLRLVLGDDMEKWVDYAAGGFFRSGRLKVFLCDYARGEGGTRLEGFRMAESEEEVREWMSHVTYCTDEKFTLPRDPSRQIMIYSLQDLQALTDGEGAGTDADGSEALERLPERTDVWGRSYSYVKEGE